MPFLEWRLGILDASEASLSCYSEKVHIPQVAIDGSIPLMPASDFARELFRPLAMDWLRKMPLDSIDPTYIVKSFVDSGNVTRSIPPVLEPGSIYVLARGELLWDTRSYDFSELFHDDFIQVIFK